jgi:hypothetical protein
MKTKWPLIPMTLGLLGPFLVFISVVGYDVLAPIGKIMWAIGAVGSVGGGSIVYFQEQRQTGIICVIVGLVLLAAVVLFHRFAGPTAG